MVGHGVELIGAVVGADGGGALWRGLVVQAQAVQREGHVSAELVGGGALLSTQGEGGGGGGGGAVESRRR